MVKERLEAYFALLPEGNHLIFTHGGALSSVLQDFDQEEMPSNGSIIGVTFDESDHSNGVILNKEFEWLFPVVEEDI